MPTGPYLDLRAGEVPFRATVRFRTVGDMLSSGAIRSTARTPREVIAENARLTVSERGSGRADDRMSDAAMEDRKREGYFWWPSLRARCCVCARWARSTT